MSAKKKTPVVAKRKAKPKAVAKAAPAKVEARVEAKKKKSIRPRAPAGPPEPEAPSSLPPSGKASAGDTEREPAPAPAPEPEPDHDDVADEIRALEERLDRLIVEAGGKDEEEALPPRSLSPSSRDGDDQGTVFDTARELLSTDFYLRRWGRLGMRNRSEEVDDFGYDPIYDARVRPVFDFLFRRWFRVACDGIDRVPSTGRCLLVANHSGTVPYDGVMLKMAMLREHPSKRDVRWLAEDFVFHFPFLGSFTNRIGAVRACQENAERLLRQESLVAVFPEGTKGIGKLFRDRYKLQRFGRGGFVKLALRTRTPIVPVAIVGGEETNPLLFRLEAFSKLLGVPYVPITATFPALGPLGLLPAPTKWRIRFGEPISTEEYSAEAEGDELLVGRLSERVRTSIQGMLEETLSKRESVFFG